MKIFHAPLRPNIFFVSMLKKNDNKKVVNRANPNKRPTSQSSTHTT